MSTKTEETSVSEVDLGSLGDLLGDTSGNVMLANEGGEKKEDKKDKKGIFSPMTPDTTFLDKPDLTSQKTEETEDVKKTEDESIKKEDENAKQTQQLQNVDTSFLDPNTEATTEPATEDEDKNKGGRPAALISATKKLIEEGFIKPFQNDKGEEEDIASYSAEDFQELLKANFEAKEKELFEQLPEQFMSQLPEELKAAYHYVAQGGTDLKGMFNHLAATEEMKSLDISTEVGQKHAIRSYLQATNYGTPEEIEDEIYSLEDRGDLEKKAKQFKPKLDSMQEQIINQRLAEQEQQNQLRAKQSQHYVESVYSTLEKGELGGMKIDNKVQNMLYSGLVQSNYPSASGKQTNMLGHLLEKYQWKEPRHDLIAEALWLLADPDGYRGSIQSAAGQKKDEETFRTLKTEQSTKNSSTSVNDDAGSDRVQRKTSSISRPKRNFFGR
jgi:hypothetical protein